MKNLYVILSLLIGVPLYISGQYPGGDDAGTEIGIVEHLDEYINQDVELVSENNERIKLKDLIDKPTVVSFVYFRCPGICSPLMDGIADVIDHTDMKIGKDFQVLTISFDTRENYELARKKKLNYINQMNKKEAENGWYFFTGDSANLASLTSSAGFKYKRTGNDFVHTAALIVLSPDGKITRYLNGTYFLPFEFKMSLIEASKGKSGPTINRILQYCYSYDPSGQHYVLNITRVAGIIIIFITFWIFLGLILKPLIRKKRTA